MESFSPDQEWSLLSGFRSGTSSSSDSGYSIATLNQTEDMQRVSTDLLSAAQDNRLDIIEDLIECTGEYSFVDTLLRCRDEYRDTPIHCAAKLGNEEVVGRFLRLPGHKKLLNAPGMTGQTPLHCTAVHVSPRSVRVGRLLLDAGANPYATDDQIYNVMHLACLHGNIKFVELLLHHSRGGTGMLEVVGGWWDQPPILLAASRGHAKVMKLLLAEGAKFDVTDSKGNNALHLFAMRGQLKAVKFFAEYSQNIGYNLLERTNSRSEKSVDVAVSQGRQDVANYLTRLMSTEDVRGRRVRSTPTNSAITIEIEQPNNQNDRVAAPTSLFWVLIFLFVVALVYLTPIIFKVALLFIPAVNDKRNATEPDAGDQRFLTDLCNRADAMCFHWAAHGWAAVIALFIFLRANNCDLLFGIHHDDERAGSKTFITGGRTTRPIFQSGVFMIFFWVPLAIQIWFCTNDGCWSETGGINNKFYFSLRTIMLVIFLLLPTAFAVLLPSIQLISRRCLRKEWYLCFYIASINVGNNDDNNDNRDDTEKVAKRLKNAASNWIGFVFLFLWFILPAVIK